MSREKLIGKHGGYARLKSFQVAQLVYDVTVRFSERYVDRFSRTRDQMVQAARSGVQNIAEGSQASATSKKTEIKLTQVARASLEELKLDYEDFLRQRGLPQWGRDDPLRQALVDRRCRTAGEVPPGSWSRPRSGLDTVARMAPVDSVKGPRSPPSPPRPRSPLTPPRSTPSFPPTPPWS
jgi:four helix bundle protein